jgi:hypothetical protein
MSRHVNGRMANKLTENAWATVANQNDTHAEIEK